MYSAEGSDIGATSYQPTSRRAALVELTRSRCMVPGNRSSGDL